MQAINFCKYQGTGNDFIMLDDRENRFVVSKTLIQQMCHRRFGIGADGLILLKNVDGYDFSMIYYNADGSEGSLCGNGARCTIQFAYDLGIFKEKTTFLAVDGVHEAYLKDNLIHLLMKDLNLVEQTPDYFFLNTGSPHTVTYIKNLKDFDVYAEGRKIRYNDRFKEVGTNVNFVEILSENEIFVRTYERGVEDETYSCGTGVVASSLVSNFQHQLKSPIKIKTLGGELQVSFEKARESTYQNIYLIGPAKKVFEGIF